MRVIKRTEINLIRQIVQLDTQEKFLPVIRGMIRWMRIGKFTGHIKIQMNAGGVMKIETEQETKSVS